MRIPFFRIFYSTTFTVIGLILAVLLLITPGNLIYEAFRLRLIYDIFIVAGVYILTFVVAVLLYASRLYANRRALVHIPKDWSPLEEKDVEKKVRKFVAKKLEESAVIAYKSRPRDLSKDSRQQGLGNQGQQDNVQVIRSNAPGDERPPEKIPPWGIISHPGWSSPSSTDLPNLQFSPIIHELANLIEAKAVSLAPPDPLYEPAATTTDDSEPPLPDALAVEFLQRPATMGLRDYFAHLNALGMIDQSDLSNRFLALYERARFSGQPLDEKDFRHLMAMFADILRGMKELDAELVAEIRADNESLLLAEADRMDVVAGDTNDAGSFDSNGTVQHTPQPDMYYTPRPDRVSLSSGSEAGSEGTVRTAPSRPGSRRNVSKASRSPSTKRRQRLLSPSSRSLRPIKSHSSSLRSQGSAGSVIRLAEARTPLDLPYTVVRTSQETL
ncbi:MAG: hypothetical protein LQ338_001958 [Usnochroma carphineum]|nr:MAG: hypothetical protein LQ338_001958 [Usnochroma carphineum]